MTALTANQEQVLRNLRREQCASAEQLTSRFGSSPMDVRTARLVLRGLEQRGYAVRSYNGNGPNEPWYWEPVIDRGKPGMLVARKGSVWDWSDRVWVEVLGGVNEYALPRVTVHAGLNSPVRTVLPWGYFVNVVHCRPHDPVTRWSAMFSCECHGECTESMVRTDKTCALCGALLNRH